MKAKRQTSLLPFEPAEHDIQKCAYFLWQEEGRPVNRDLDLWLSAKGLVRHHVPKPRPHPGSRRRPTL